MAQHVYNDDFYDYISRGSRASAEVVVPLLRANLPIASVADIGSGAGAWLAVWLEAGVSDIRGVDGAYVDTTKLRIPATAFTSHDLATPFDLGRRFDLVQSLEVAEHLPEARAEGFVDSLVAHGDIVMFSAAVPHQGGEYHVNEQVPDYWRRKFAARGFACFDWLRPLLADRRAVKPWYRFNTLLYANAAGQARLSAVVLARRVADSATVPMRGDAAWAARRAAVALIPAKGRHAIARAKAAIEARAFGRS
jgi:hypothetical protein